MFVIKYVKIFKIILIKLLIMGHPITQEDIDMLSEIKIDKKNLFISLSFLSLFSYLLYNLLS